MAAPRNQTCDHEAIGGFGIMLVDINLNALQAAVVHDDLRSRVSGAFSTVSYGIRPLGALVGGVLASFVGTGPTLVMAAVGGTPVDRLADGVPHPQNTDDTRSTHTCRLDS